LLFSQETAQKQNCRFFFLAIGVFACVFISRALFFSERFVHAYKHPSMSE